MERCEALQTLRRLIIECGDAEGMLSSWLNFSGQRVEGGLTCRKWKSERKECGELRWTANFDDDKTIGCKGRCND